MKAKDVPCKEPEEYSNWITPKFSDIERGSQLTDEHIKDLKLRDSLQLAEREVFIEMLYNREKALAFDFSHLERVSHDMAPPQVIKMIPHKA